MIIIVLILLYFLLNEACIDLWNYFVSIIISISICIGLIWLNVFLSNTLCSHISNHFIFISLILNIVAYLIIALIAYLIDAFIFELFDFLHPKKQLSQNEIKYQRKQLHEKYLSRNNVPTSNNSTIKKDSFQNAKISNHKADEILLKRSLNKELGLDGKKSNSNTSLKDYGVELGKYD